MSTCLIEEKIVEEKVYALNHNYTQSQKNYTKNINYVPDEKLPRGDIRDIFPPGAIEVLSQAWKRINGKEGYECIGVYVAGM